MYIAFQVLSHSLIIFSFLSTQTLDSVKQRWKFWEIIISEDTERLKAEIEVFLLLSLVLLLRTIFPSSKRILRLHPPRLPFLHSKLLQKIDVKSFPCFKSILYVLWVSVFFPPFSVFFFCYSVLKKQEH